MDKIMCYVDNFHLTLKEMRFVLKDAHDLLYFSA